MKKSDLPTKTCVVCRRPFTWRKKWSRCWDEVKYCSERCRRQSRRSTEPKTKDDTDRTDRLRGRPSEGPNRRFVK